MDLMETFGLDPHNPLDTAAAQMAEQRYSVPEQLAAVRNENHITQEEAATRMHTSQAAISQIENGQRDPRMSTLYNYANAIHANITFTVENTDKPHASSAYAGKMEAEDAWKESSQYSVSV